MEVKQSGLLGFVLQSSFVLHSTHLYWSRSQTSEPLQSSFLLHWTHSPLSTAQAGNDVFFRLHSSSVWHLLHVNVVVVSQIGFVSVEHWAVSVHSTQTFETGPSEIKQCGLSGFVVVQSVSFVHSTHLFCVRSQTSEPLQSSFLLHWTHSPLSTAQAGNDVFFRLHSSSVWHLLHVNVVVVSQIGFVSVEHWAVSVHSTQIFMEVKQSGLLGFVLQSSFVLHSTHLYWSRSQTSEPLQSSFLLHWTHSPLSTAQAGNDVFFRLHSSSVWHLLHVNVVVVSQIGFVSVEHWAVSVHSTQTFETGPSEIKQCGSSGFLQSVSFVHSTHIFCVRSQILESEQSLSLVHSTQTLLAVSQTWSPQFESSMQSTQVFAIFPSSPHTFGSGQLCVPSHSLHWFSTQTSSEGQSFSVLHWTHTLISVLQTGLSVFVQSASWTHS